MAKYITESALGSRGTRQLEPVNLEPVNLEPVNLEPVNP